MGQPTCACPGLCCLGKVVFSEVQRVPFKMTVQIRRHVLPARVTGKSRKATERAAHHPLYLSFNRSALPGRPQGGSRGSVRRRS